MEIEDEEKKEYNCPANPSHKIIGQKNFHNHIFRCKDVKGRRLYQCMYEWTHMFHYPEERDFHETKCPDKREGVGRGKDFLFLPREEEPMEKIQEKYRNKERSQDYYYRNKDKLQYEKELKRKIREKKEQKEQEEMKVKEEQRIIHRNENQHLNYSHDYVLENSFYFETSFASVYMILVGNGTRKMEKRSLVLTQPMKLENKLKDLSQQEYNRVLAGEFIGHVSYDKAFKDLKQKLDEEEAIACMDYCQTNDELVLMTSSKHLPYLAEARLALLVVQKSKFMANQRPFNIPENNTSHIFANNYLEFLEKNYTEGSNKPENDTIIATYEYREEIKKKHKAIMELLQESMSNQDILDYRNEENQLKGLLAEREKLKANEIELNKREERMGNQFDEYKRAMVQEAGKQIRMKQEELNVKINNYYRSKAQELDKNDEKVSQLEEEETELLRRVQSVQMEIEARKKKRKKDEGRVHYFESLIAEKKKNISVSKNLALTKVLDSLCHVCQLNPINILFYPCNHFFVCEECQKKASEAGRHECLYCLNSVEKVIRVLV